MKNNIASTVILSIVIGLLGGYALGAMMTDGQYKKMSHEEMDIMMGHEHAEGMDDHAHPHEDEKGDMDHMMMSMTERMKGKTGDELDRIFLEDMIVHHQGAIDMADILAKETKRPELQKMAADIISVQSAEIAMMEGWLTDWYGGE